MSKRGRRVGGRLKKQQRKQKCQRENAAHRHSRKLADTAHTVVLKDLNTKGMTASAKGTVEEPGRNVRQKAGLNREILKSIRGRLERCLDYKAGQVVRVDPASTSRTCAVCGHIGRENRGTQAHFRCTACGHTANADCNTAQNILAQGLALCPTARGTGAAARREALDPCPLPVATVKSTSTTRRYAVTAEGVSSWVHRHISPKRCHPVSVAQAPSPKGQLEPLSAGGPEDPPATGIAGLARRYCCR